MGEIPVFPCAMLPPGENTGRGEKIGLTNVWKATPSRKIGAMWQTFSTFSGSDVLEFSSGVCLMKTPSEAAK